jgi:PAS domain-containing protein
MKKMCAWCGTQIGPAGESMPDDAVTHGICEDCRDNITFQEGVAPRELLDALAAPIVMVDSRGVVRAANKAASALLGRQPDEIKGYLPGEVFECEFARLPEGCGDTVHCTGCAIRRTVMAPLDTGESFSRVPATLRRHTPEDPQDVRFLISTEKVADTVLLRVDQVGG